MVKSIPMEINTLLIAQARMNSTRLPGKVLKTINGEALLDIQIKRLKKCKNIDRILIATTDNPTDEAIYNKAIAHEVLSYRGSENDVLDRFYQAAKPLGPKWIIRVTCDCPLLDPELVDAVIKAAKDADVDYCSNTLEISYPDGMDVEVFKFSALEKAWEVATSSSEREHVTPFLYNNSTFKGNNLFSALNFPGEEKYGDIRLTVDEPQDLEVIKVLVDVLGINEGWKKYADYYLNSLEIKKINEHIQRNEGYLKSLEREKNITMITNFDLSNEMIERAQEIIPGGCHTYSKGPDQSPFLGPKVISHGKGSHVWDVDGNEYIDWAMGLTSVSLGHAFEPVLDAVRKELGKGVNFQCPSPIETELAELFLSAVPSADMVKFAKNGSTVTTAAIKLARAYTGKKYVAFCEDHGFFSYDDWYIGKKPNNSGVPEEISNLTLSFKYNDIQSVQNLFEIYPGQIACLILEPMEFDLPKDNFLHKVKDLCHKNGAIFILDEMITGFKLGFPGAHTMLDIEPDLSTWGKGIANGFSTCILAGKKEIMELGGVKHDKEKVFLISTTHGAETHSLSAAIASIKYMRDHNTIDSDYKKGLFIRENIEKLIEKHQLQNCIEIKGHPCWLLMVFKDNQGKSSDGFKTLMFQELIKNGILFRGSFNISISHSSEDLDKTFNAFDKAFFTYSLALKEGYEKFLVGDPVKPVFRKWN
jgi:glutamate-1-semialdehyde aminotransferase/spore coat polysaccharide biosynthesis protein SpsF (cytidylyltransferase family)